MTYEEIIQRKENTFNFLINMHDLDKKVLIRKVMEQLTPKEQLILYRRYYQNQSYSSIAEELKITRERVRQKNMKIHRIIIQKIIIGQM